MKPPTRREPARLDFVALLGALCLFLSAIEYLLPKPVPFLRIGIANLPILIGLDLLPAPLLLLVVLLKVVGQGLIGGTLFSYVFLFSVVGSFSSGLAMLAVRGLFGRRISLVGVGIMGALFSNAAQIALARLLIFGKGAWLIAPPFLALGTVTSVLLGLFAERFRASSRWLASVTGGRSAAGGGARDRRRPPAGVRGAAKAPARPPPARKPRAPKPPARAPRPPTALSAFLRANASPGMLLLCGGLLMVSFFAQTNPAVRVAEMCGFALLGALSGKRVRLFQNSLVFLSIVAFNLFVPTGKVLASILGLSITDGALKGGLLKAAAMIGLIALSQFTLQSRVKLPGRIGGLLGKSLFYFQQIMGGRERIDRRDLVGSIDGLLLGIQAGGEGPDRDAAAHGTTVKGALLLAGLVVVFWGAYAATALLKAL
jgi:uncharacterized membrane protein